MDIPYYLQCFSERLRIQRYNPATIKNYRSTVGSFLTATAGQLTFCDDLDILHIEKYLFAKIKKEPISSSHQRILLVCITKFYDLVLDKKINLRHLYPKRTEHKLPNYLTLAEVIKLIEATDNLKHKSMIMLLYSGGLRLREVINLKLADIDSKAMTITIRQAKGNKYRQVMLSENFLIIFNQYYSKYRPDYYVFEGQNNAQYSGRSIQQVVKQSALKAGLNKTVSPHILRHSFATHLLEAGIDIRYIQELLGHNYLKSTEVYTLVTAVSKTQINSPLDRI